jgi:DNA polymerase-1
MENEKLLLLIDANSLLHRAYHALPPLTAKDGSPAGALYGLSGALLKIIKERHPEYLAAAFDRPEPTRRSREYAAYKATRPKVEEELVNQLIAARGLFQNFGIAYFEKPGYEADDLIASLVGKFRGSANLKILVLSSDQDLLQLVEGDRIQVEAPVKGISNTVIYDAVKVEEKFSISPQEIPDYKGLVGDQSDNIPGVPGVGPKTAAQLIAKYGSVENLIQQFREMGISESKIAEKLKGNEEQALLSKKLAKLEEIKLDTSLNDLSFKLDKKRIAEYLSRLGFASLVSRLGSE